MKRKLLFLAFILISAFANAQYPLLQYLGSDSTIVKSRGGLQGRFAPIPFTDTAAANLSRISQYPGALIYTSGVDKYWYRNSGATGWIEFTSSGGSTVNIYNSNGVLTGDRNLDGTGFSLGFHTLSKFWTQSDTVDIELLSTGAKVFNIHNLTETQDTTTYKPMVVDPVTGRVLQSSYWYGSGGSGGIESLGNTGILWLTRVNDSTYAADSAAISSYLLRRKDSLTASNPLGYVTRQILADSMAAQLGSGSIGIRFDSSYTPMGGARGADSFVVKSVRIRRNNITVTPTQTGDSAMYWNIDVPIVDSAKVIGNELIFYMTGASDINTHLPTHTLDIDSTYTPLAGQSNDSTWRLKSMRVQAGDSTVNPTVTDSTVNFNIPMVQVDTAGVAHNMEAYWDTTGTDKVKFRVPTGGSGSGAFSILQFRIGDELSPSVGDTSLINSGFSGKYLKVFRNGLLQEHVFNDTGFYRLTDSAIRVTPAFTAVDQFLIEARDSASLTQLALETPPAASLLLDTYTGATGAYSLRLLRTAYSGNAIKVRRSSDNTTQDIAFLPSGYLDTASMKTFVSTGTGYIDTWYDQSTNGYNLTQATTGNQPIIIESGGTVYRQEGKVSVKFTSASSHYLSNTSITAASAADAYIAQVFKSNSAGSNYIPFGMSGQNFAYQHGSAANRIYAYAGNVYGDFANSSTSLALSETIYDGGGATSADRLKYYLDGTGLTASSYSGTVPATVSFTGLAMGRLYAVGVYFDGACSEFIVWTSDKAADRTGIESNINTHYNLY